MLTVRKSQGRSHIVFYLILSSITLLLGIIDLNLPVWIDYCWWEFGLFDASNNSRIKDFSDNQSIQDLHDQACGSLKYYVERSCPSACEYFDGFKHAGVVMVAFGVIAIVFNALNIGILVWKLAKKKVRRVWTTCFWVPFVVWLFGFSVYAGLARLGRLDGPVNKDSYNFDADQYGIKVGVQIAIALVTIYLLTGVYGWFVIRPFVIGLK